MQAEDLAKLILDIRNHFLKICQFQELTNNKYKVSKNQIMMKKFQFSWEKSMVFHQLK